MPEYNFLSQEGVTACRRVRIDFERLKALKAGDRLALLPGHGVIIIIITIDIIILFRRDRIFSTYPGEPV